MGFSVEECKYRASMATKIAKVMEEVESLPKNGWNDHFSYAFAEEADVTEALRKSFIKNNLVLFVGSKGTGINSTVEKVTHITLGIRILDTDTGYEMYGEVPATGYDSSDKGSYKAITGAVKYFLMKTFMIPTYDDAEKAGKDKPAATGGASRPPAAPKEQTDNHTTLESAINGWLLATHGAASPANFADKLESLTAFTVDGRLIKGKRKLEDLSDKAAYTTYVKNKDDLGVVSVENNEQSTIDLNEDIPF